MNARVIAQNNAAVQLLRQGLCTDAAVAFKVVLLDLQEAFRYRNSGSGFNGLPHAGSPARKGCPQSPQSCDQMTATPDIPMYEQPTLLSGTPLEFNKLEGNTGGSSSRKDTRPNANAFMALYDRAFCLPFHETRERVLSSVILYNCALASHISGLSGPNFDDANSSKNLLNAMRLYKYAYRILHEVGGDAESTELLRLALYNNMGHASFQLFHLEEASFYVQHLRDHMGLSENYPMGAPLPTIDDEDYDFFSFNVSCNIAIVGAPAA